jgi:hypothetical protein
VQALPRRRHGTLWAVLVVLLFALAAAWSAAAPLMFAGQNPPLCYALVGWPSLLLTGEAGPYAMRLVSAAISAAMLACGRSG